MAFSRFSRFVVRVADESQIPPETVTQFAIGGQTFTLGSPRQIVRHADCDGQAVVCIVVPTGTETVTVSPGRAVNGTRTVNGAMLNPRYLGGASSEQSAVQGFDSALHGWTPAASINTAQGVPLGAGDILATQISKVNYGSNTRAGVVDEWAAVYVATSAPHPSSLAPPIVGWPGRSSVAPSAPIDWEAKAAALPAHISPAALPRTPAQMMTDLRFNIGPAYSKAEAYALSYEGITPFNWGAHGQSSNWGGNLVQGVASSALLALISSAPSPADKVRLLKLVTSFGRQTYETWKANGIRPGGNGGHNQFQIGAMLAYLWVTDQTALIPDLVDDVGGGNTEQAFTLSPAQAALLVPHNQNTSPYPWRRRTVASVSGNQITVPLFVGFPGDPSRGSFTGGLIVRESDGALAFVTGTSTDQWGGRSTVTVTIAAQPSPAIAPNDVVHFRPSWGTPQAGHVDWTINGTNMFAFYNPMASAVYRDNQRHAAQLLFVHALGLLPADLTSWRDYTVACNVGNYPSGDDWPSVHSNSYSQAFWTNHWTTISQVPQIGTATPPTALTITRAARPEDTTALVDGWGPGLMPGETEASIRISGTATGGNGTTVQFRLVPHGGGTPIVDWTPIGTISNGAYAGNVTIPRSTGWCRLEVRSAANQAVTAAFGGRWALGRKVLVIGQSQVGIWNGDSQNWYAPVAGNSDTGSVVSWQALGGSSENLRVIGAATSDGPQAFLDQWRAIDPETPLFVIVDAVGGTSILQLLDDDASGNRAWSDLTAKLDKYGTDVCVVIDNWGTSNNSPLSGLSGGGTVGDRFFNLALGTNLHGSGADHDFADVLRSGFVWGHSPVTRHSHNGSMDGYRQSTVAAANARGIAVGPPVNDFPIHSGNSAHQAASYQSDGPERGTSVLGARMAIAGLRALGLDTSQNPSVNAAIRSADGTKITVSFNLPNGGSLYSNAPAALSQFLVSENGGTSWTKTSFTTAIVGNTVELTKTSGVWVGTLSLRVRFESDPKVYTDPSNATTVVNSVQSFQQEIQAADGIVMESWAPCIFGWGLPVSGQVTGGVWSLPQTVTLVPGQG